MTALKAGKNGFISSRYSFISGSLYRMGSPCESSKRIYVTPIVERRMRELHRARGGQEQQSSVVLFTFYTWPIVNITRFMENHHCPPFWLFIH